MPLEQIGRLYFACMHSIISYDSKKLVKEVDMIKQERNEARRIRWMCNVRTKTRTSAIKLKKTLQMNTKKRISAG